MYKIHKKFTLQQQQKQQQPKLQQLECHRRPQMDMEVAELIVITMSAHRRFAAKATLVRCRLSIYKFKLYKLNPQRACH